MTFVMMAAEMRMTFKLPVGDFSHLWPDTDLEMGRAERKAQQTKSSHCFDDA